MTALKGHYWLLVLEDGKDHVKRVYIQKTHLDEPVEDAVERWVNDQMTGRQRNRVKVGAKLRASILYTHNCRPSSWHRERAEAADVVVGRRTRRKS